MSNKDIEYTMLFREKAKSIENILADREIAVQELQAINKKVEELG